jgi:hypothetical protein
LINENIFNDNSMLLLLQYTHAQQKENTNNNTDKKETSVIPKGYYTIGNNAEQLSRKGTMHSDVSTTTQKGYYAIGNNKQKPVKRRGL